MSNCVFGCVEAELKLAIFTVRSRRKKRQWVTFWPVFLCCKIGKKDNGQKADYLKISPWVCLCVQKSEKKLDFKFFGGDHVEHLEYDNGNGFNAFWCLIREKNR